MFERTIDIDGKNYHADDDGNILLDEDGDSIPSYVCICFAHSAIECSCGAWDRPIPGIDKRWGF